MSSMFFSQNLDDKELIDLVHMSMADDNLDYHDDGYIEIVLRMMGLMCDNQNTTLQVCVFIIYYNLHWTNTYMKLMKLILVVVIVLVNKMIDSCFKCYFLVIVSITFQSKFYAHV